MTLTEGLLFTIVIILTVLLCKRKSGASHQTTKEWDCVDKSTGKVTTVAVQYNHGPGCTCARCNPEQAALRENNEHFASAADAGISPLCSDSAPFAENLYGAQGLSYKDYIMNESVDPQIVANHSAFVFDQSSSSSNILGTTKCFPGALDDTSSISWQGIRRPMALPASASGNPTQVSDGFRDTDFTNGSSLIWNANTGPK